MCDNCDCCTCDCDECNYEPFVDTFDYANAEIIATGKVTTDFGLEMDSTTFKHKTTGELKIIINSDYAFNPLPKDLFP